MPKLTFGTKGMYAIVMTSTSNDRNSKTFSELDDLILSLLSSVYRKPYYQQRIKKVEMVSRINNFEDPFFISVSTIIKCSLGYNSKSNRHTRESKIARRRRSGRKLSMLKP